jgi:hypothetical protein
LFSPLSHTLGGTPRHRHLLTMGAQTRGTCAACGNLPGWQTTKLHMDNSGFKYTKKWNFQGERSTEVYTWHLISPAPSLHRAPTHTVGKARDSSWFSSVSMCWGSGLVPWACGPKFGYWAIPLAWKYITILPYTVRKYTITLHYTVLPEHWGNLTEIS